MISSLGDMAILLSVYYKYILKVEIKKWLHFLRGKVSVAEVLICKPQRKLEVFVIRKKVTLT